ncbi:MAG: redoxin family protein [Bryobacteraceae bacterium]|nr:redoxin family protein [Bryobacteraceae bacterium]
MTRWLLLLALAVPLAGFAQEPEDAEQRALSGALSEAGSSPVEFIRALEKHLDKFPASKRRAGLERALVKAAIEARDDRRIVLYGEKVLKAEDDDLQVLERVARALLEAGDEESSKRALRYAKRYGSLIAELRKEKAPGRRGLGEWTEDLDRGEARAQVLAARALGQLGKISDAVSHAQKAFEAYPNAESAREAGRWLAKANKPAEATARFADAVSIADSRATDADRVRDRGRMGEIYREWKGSESGLGEILLASFDRNTRLLAERAARIAALDPNANQKNLMGFTLSGLKGATLPMASLQGKVVVLDFWATWCGPCRVQHPLYEKVKQRFHGKDEVQFLSVNTDEERDRVEPFLREQKWDASVWFESGLSRTLQISSIPTTIVVNKRGEVVNRMVGFVPERFVDMLSERITDALSTSAP